MGWSVIAAMRSKSLSTCKTVSRESSTAAAMSRSGIEGERWFAKRAALIDAVTGRESDLEQCDGRDSHDAARRN